MNNDNSCPNCGRIDLVQSMPAIAATGMSTAYGSSTYAGAGIGFSGTVAPVIGSASTTTTQTSALAAATSPAPPTSSVTGPAACGVLLLVVTLIMLAFLRVAVAFNTPAAGESGPGIGGWLVLGGVIVLPFAIPSLIAFLVLARRSRANARITRGLPAASALWKTAFYCHRCGICYWPRRVSGGTAARQLLSPYQFQQIVWDAGGYGFGRQPR